MQFSNYVTSLTIPIGNEQLLLPSVAVSEMLRHVNLDVELGQPDWLLGLITWREWQIPLLSIEEMTGFELCANTPKNPYIVILPASPQNGLNYYAFKTSGMPHSVAVTEADLNQAKQIENHPGVLAKVHMNDNPFWLPDLDYIEEALQEALPQ